MSNVSRRRQSSRTSSKIPALRPRRRQATAQGPQGAHVYASFFVIFSAFSAVSFAGFGSSRRPFLLKINPFANEIGAGDDSEFTVLTIEQVQDRITVQLLQL